jgi:hypothetical protein
MAYLFVPHRQYLNDARAIPGGLVAVLADVDLIAPGASRKE